MYLVIGCLNLDDKEWISRQDPYVCLEYGSTKYRTKICTGIYTSSSLVRTPTKKKKKYSYQCNFLSFTKRIHIQSMFCMYFYILMNFTFGLPHFISCWFVRWRQESHIPGKVRFPTYWRPAGTECCGLE